MRLSLNCNNWRPSTILRTSLSIILMTGLCRPAAHNPAHETSARELTRSRGPAGYAAVVGKRRPYGGCGGRRQATALREMRRSSASDGPTGDAAVVGKRRPCGGCGGRRQATALRGMRPVVGKRRAFPAASGPIRTLEPCRFYGALIASRRQPPLGLVLSWTRACLGVSTRPRSSFHDTAEPPN